MEKVQWLELRSRIETVLSDSTARRELYAKLDAIASELRRIGVSDHVYVDAKRFGEPILQANPRRWNSLDASDNRTTQVCSTGSFPSDLAYSNVPLGLLLRNGVEIFDERNERTSNLTSQPRVHHAPLKLLYQGDLFGVFESLDYLAGETAPSKNPWTMSAGARSVQFSFSFGNRSIASAITKAEDIFGISARLGQAQGYTHHAIACRIVKAICPQWRVEYIMFPEQWLFEGGVDPRVRAEFERTLFKLGWGQAQPLLKDLKDAFLAEWSRPGGLRINTLPAKVDRALGLFAYHLHGIDRRLEPCLIDVRSIHGSDKHELVKQLVPADEVLLFSMLVAHFHGVTTYPTVLLPGYVSAGVRGCYLSFDRDEVALPENVEYRKEFLGRVFASMGLAVDKRRPLYDPQQIDPESITLIGGANRGPRERLFIIDIFDIDIYRTGQRNYCQERVAQFGIGESLLALCGGKLSSDVSRALSNSHLGCGGFGKDGLSFHLRFSGRS